MASVNDNEETSIVLEGIYNGVAGKLEEVKSSVSRELQYGSTQQIAAYEALTDTVRNNVETILSEFRYLSQQSSIIHEVEEQSRSESQAVLLEAVHAESEETEKRVTEKLAAVEEKFSKRLSELENSLVSLTNAILSMTLVDSQKVANEASEKRAASDAEPARQESKKPVAENMSAESAMQENGEPAAEYTAEEPVDEAIYAPLDEAQINYDLLAQKTADSLASDERFDINVLAEKLASAVSDPDYDPLVDKIVASIPIPDADAVADKIVSALPASDDQLLAEKVADAIPPVDYDLIAERVSAVLEHEFDVTVSEEGIDKIAKGVAEKINYEELAERVARLLNEGRFVIAAPVVQPVTVVETVEPKRASVVELAAAEEVSVPKASPVVFVPAQEEDPEMFTRLKKSFEAKIIESEDEVKENYSELKNAFLSFSKVRSQMSWSNERFTLSRETLAKIAIRGKTLCLYLALDPDEFPETVYHQKYAGDTKMYEKTPMMLKIKTPIAVKRGIRLIELLMERNGAVQTDAEPVDYVKRYAWRSEEELLKAGLIKTAVVEKSDLDF